MQDYPGKYVLVDFFAEWCGPCRMLGPKFEKLNEDETYGDQIVYGKVDVDENEETADEEAIEGK